MVLSMLKFTIPSLGGRPLTSILFDYSFLEFNFLDIDIGRTKHAPLLMEEWYPSTLEMGSFFKLYYIDRV